MNPNGSRLESFEQRLLDALKNEIETAGARDALSGTRRRHVAMILTAAVVAVTVGLAAPLALGDHSGAKAYAVTEAADGSVTVRIFRLQDAAGLERALRSHGIRADITYLPPGKQCREPRYVRSAQSWGPSDEETSHGVTLTFDPPIPATGTWVMEYTGHQAKPHGPLVGGGPGGFGITFLDSVGFTQGPVAPCVLVPR